MSALPLSASPRSSGSSGNQIGEFFAVLYMVNEILQASGIAPSALAVAAVATEADTKTDTEKAGTTVPSSTSASSSAGMRERLQQIFTRVRALQAEGKSESNTSNNNSDGTTALSSWAARADDDKEAGKKDGLAGELESAYAFSLALLVYMGVCGGEEEKEEEKCSPRMYWLAAIMYCSMLLPAMSPPPAKAPWSEPCSACGRGGEPELD